MTAPRLALCLLFASAGPLAAEGIELSGRAEMGLTGGAGRAQGAAVQAVADLDLLLRLSRTTDGGLTIAVEIDLDDLVPAPDTQVPRRPPPP
ncbi:hypothetical protein [Roseicyclus persicicus]|uniref:Uncharacterized protein n=1 Tax=Roseicyclus persicicus TaxID=2650661 RepID=A0A7X6K0G6_9RHOB|nr:hypothetical protein [Roseibacterium persicicum]NKX45853.1 hypothetical protein [Roseibacterium persicicum]